MTRVVITGGSGGLGSAVAEEFRTAGHDVSSLSSRDLDVTEETAVTKWFQGRRVELLVCCAGMASDALLVRLSPDTWREMWEVNFLGAIRCARAAFPVMKENGGGHIVFVSSYSAAHPPVGQAAYATAKAALLGWMADHVGGLGAHGIRINAVFPGFLETKMTSTVSHARREEILDQHALGCFNTPTVAAGFIRFLHEHMPHTSGQTFSLDSRPL